MLLIGAIYVSAAAPPSRAPDRHALQQIERDRSALLARQHEAALRARAAEADEQRRVSARVAAAAKLRTLETATSDAASRIEVLARRRAEVAARLAERADAFSPMLPLIERLSLYPAETLLAVPAEPQAAVRGLLVLGALGRQLEQDAVALRAERTELTRLGHEIEAELPRLQAAQTTQAAQAAELDRQIAAAREGRYEAEDEAADAARRAAAAAGRADSLRAALQQIEVERQRAEARARTEAAQATRQQRITDAADARRRQEALARPAGPGLSEARGDLTAPVAGALIRGWGDRTDAGLAHGVSYQAPPAARVVAPCNGRAVFAAPFRSFGLLLIVDCGGGYHVVLAGFERLDVQAGRKLQQGEPVGIMPGWDPQAAGPHPSLYVELRHDGQPINPIPFLKAHG